MIHKDLYAAIQTAFKKERLYFGTVDGVWNKDTANAYQGWCLKNNVTGIQARQQPTGLHDIEPNLRNLITGLSKATVTTAPTPVAPAPVVVEPVPVVKIEPEPVVEPVDEGTDAKIEEPQQEQGQGHNSKHSKNRR